MTLFFAALLCVLTGWNETAFADRYRFDPSVRVEIISDERGLLAKYSAGYGAHRTRRSYIAVRDNERYRIRVTNRSNERIGLVIAVDGRNIISGSHSHLRPHERMYVLDPWESSEYEGWRTGRNRVNRFYFTGMSDSYAAAWGDGSAMGVIAVAVYRERHDNLFKPRKKYDQHGGPDGRPGRRGWREPPGTGFGETEWSPSRPTYFSPEKHPAYKEFIRYEWRSTLCRRGVISCRPKRTRHDRPWFFPEPHRDDGFAPFPPLWPFLR
ncbi:MAG: hypothetical protein Kow0089_01520 [Desulfobulbaceae bacterium]